MKEGRIGNAKAGIGEWLVIEADESDGSIVQYKPEMGVLLNIDKDHKEMDALMEIFREFKKNTREHFIVNLAQAAARELSQDKARDFSTDPAYPAGYQATDFDQQGLAINFAINKTEFTMHTVGRHNMENALAASAVANQLGVDLPVCAEALTSYEGIYRRHQVLGKKQGVWLIDDYAHNPIKCAVSIQACQGIAPKVIAWFQPHGYGPTRFLRKDFVTEIGRVLRAADEIWMSEIFYAGGTAVKDISAADLIDDLKAMGKSAFFVEDRNHFLEKVRPELKGNCVLLLMGARDPSLENFAKQVWEQL
jgi:UDP-N-acetylmuramate--alanine ligase